MSNPFIFINTYKIRPGKAERYRQLCDEVTELVDAKEPDMLYFACGISDDGRDASTVQIHVDASNMANHMEIAGPIIGQAMQECLDPSQMAIDIYGTPPAALLDQLRAVAGTGVTISVHQPGPAVDRLTSR